jgi:hypothetical protein
VLALIISIHPPCQAGSPQQNKPQIQYNRDRRRDKEHLQSIGEETLIIEILKMGEEKYFKASH